MSADLLPLFPLQLVVFPGEKLNLHIFEPRYRQLIKESQDTGKSFGIPAFIDGKVMKTGTEMELLNIEKIYPDGKMDVKTRGIGVFDILNFYRIAPEKLYSGGEIQKKEDVQNGDLILKEQILGLIKELFHLLNIKKEVPENGDDFSTFSMGHHVGFNLEQEYEFLCQGSEAERQLFMKSHLEQLIPTVREMENLRKKAQMNGHFKNILPPKI